LVDLDITYVKIFLLLFANTIRNIITIKSIVIIMNVISPFPLYKRL